jgi:hypothetical protein
MLLLRSKDPRLAKYVIALYTVHLNGSGISRELATTQCIVIVKQFAQGDQREFHRTDESCF